MSIPQTSEIVEAIVAFSSKRLEELIKKGAKVDVLISSSADLRPANEIINECSGPSLLHLAVLCLYHAVSQVSYNEGIPKEALKILEILIANGADAKRGCSYIGLKEIAKYEFYPWRESSPHDLPINLALHLKNYPWGLRKDETHEYLIRKDETHEYLNCAIELLEEAAKRPVTGCIHIGTTPVMTSVTTMYEKMLFSEKFSDVTFQCSDGVSIPAHKNILAASSPYFERVFDGSGNWAENNKDGIWETAHSSTLMKSILRILYTGSVEKCEELLKDKKFNPLDLFDVSCEYDIQSLIDISLDKCVRSIQEDNVKIFLQKAHLHSNTQLKNACFNFIQCNSAKVLMRPDMMGLATEDPDLWAELGTYMNGAPTSNKRTRTK